MKPKTADLNFYDQDFLMDQMVLQTFVVSLFGDTSSNFFSGDVASFEVTKVNPEVQRM